MSRPRRRIFGPFFYLALLAWGLVAIFWAVEVARPGVETWLAQRAILKALRSPDIKTRQRTVLGLERESPGFGRAYLVEALGDPSLDVRVSACRSLAQQGYEPQTLIPILSAAANDEQVETRIETTRILSRIIALAGTQIHSSADGRTEAAVEARSASNSILYRMLRDQVPEVRAAAADALGETGLDSSVATELIAVAGDPDRGVRLAIAKALLRINGRGDHTAADILTSLVTDREPVSDRSEAMKLVLQTNDETRNRAMLALAELVSHTDSLVQPDLLDCLCAAGFLARAALPALEKLLDDPEPGTRAAAVRAILAIQTDGSTPGGGMMGGGSGGAHPRSGLWPDSMRARTAASPR